MNICKGGWLWLLVDHLICMKFETKINSTNNDYWKNDFYFSFSSGGVCV